MKPFHLCMHMNYSLKIIFTFFALSCISFSNAAFGSSPLRLLSPHKKILYEFEILNGRPGYRVSYEGRLLIDFSTMDIVFKGDSLIQGVRQEKTARMDSLERYSLLTGRSSLVNDQFRQLSLYLKETKSPGHRVLVQVRAFDDGLAFRYIFPESNGDSLVITQERSGFQITGNLLVHALVLDDYYSSHEGNYLHRSYQDLPKDSLLDMPMLFEFPDNIFIAITEAALLDYAGMYLIKTKSGLVSKLSPLPSNPEYAVIASLPHVSPWRVILISHRPGRFLETNLRDDQEMVNIQTEILQKAAAHHLHIQFHDAYKPTGLSRTYLNEFTREGALNYEHDKWNPKGISPDHDLDIAFTRLIAGSTDYHLGGFRAVEPSAFRAQYTRPLVLGTRSHMLAMYVVLENANAMVCDYPEAYENQPGFDIVQKVPTAWDETQVLKAAPDQYIVVGRKKNDSWWIGSITGNTSRTLQIPLLFLGQGIWKSVLYQDDLKSPFNPNGIMIKTINVNPSTILEIPLAAGGGFAIKLEKQ